MKLRLLVFLSAVCVLGLAACQIAPTKTFETKPVVAKESPSPMPLSSEIVVSEKTIILDARAPFDFALAHLNGSLNVRPEDFNQQEDALAGLLEKDLFFHARRLARMGISLDSEIVVVGKGVLGRGEEGRVAWTLRYMGVKNVRFVAIDYFSMPLTNAEAPPRENVAIWKPVLDDSLLVTRKEFLKAVTQPHLLNNSAVIVDVRTVEEYLGKRNSGAYGKAPDLGAVNVPWVQFFTSKGQPSESIKERLQLVGITPEKKIFVISNHGIESAAVTVALRDLGYPLAANYAGGYVELIANSKRK
jgi:thiosulfate/3-mercaptopyruvate sulfurtransferase